MVPRPGDRVEALLLEEKTKNGGWKAKHPQSGLVGPVQNTAEVPGDKQPGETLTLIVSSVSPRDIAFKYPTAKEDERAQKPRPKPAGGPAMRGPRR